MVIKKISVCPCCGGQLKYYDRVSRIIRTKNRKSEWIYIRRLRCLTCGILHRELPDSLFPYKQYEAEVIRGVLEGVINSETIGYEDYPCEATMERWRAKNTSPIMEGGDTRERAYG